MRVMNCASFISPVIGTEQIEYSPGTSASN